MRSNCQRYGYRNLCEEPRRIDIWRKQGISNRKGSYATMAEKRFTDDGKTSYLPASFAEVIDAYVLNFIKDGISDIHCKECGRSTADIEPATRNHKVTGPWSEWTDAWRCQAGHLLYTEDHEIHILRRREPSQETP